MRARVRGGGALVAERHANEGALAEKPRRSSQRAISTPPWPGRRRRPGRRDMRARRRRARSRRPSLGDQRPDLRRAPAGAACTKPSPARPARRACSPGRRKHRSSAERSTPLAARSSATMLADRFGAAQRDADAPRRARSARGHRPLPALEREAGDEADARDKRRRRPASHRAPARDLRGASHSTQTSQQAAPGRDGDARHRPAPSRSSRRRRRTAAPRRSRSAGPRRRARRGLACGDEEGPVVGGLVPAGGVGQGEPGGDVAAAEALDRDSASESAIADLELGRLAEARAARLDPVGDPVEHRGRAAPADSRTARAPRVGVGEQRGRRLAADDARLDAEPRARARARASGPRSSPGR